MRVLTANRLADGEVVFWAGQGWSERFAGARVFADEIEGAQAQARAASAITEVVDPYLVDVAPIAEDADPVAPVSYRERLRALGPSNKPGHGKQAAGGREIERLAGARGAARSAGRVNLIRRK